MDGENHGKPCEQMDDLGVFPCFWKWTQNIFEEFSPQKFGEDEPNLTKAYFSDGWEKTAKQEFLYFFGWKRWESPTDSCKE